MAKKAETMKLKFADLTKKPAGELAPFLADNVKTYGTINTAKEKFVEMLQFTAKVIAAFERLYTERLNKSDIPANTSFKEYLKQNAGGEVPGRALALANLFNTLVLTLDKAGNPLLPEDFFDAAKVDWLEKANAIISAARKEHGENWKASADVLDVINALSKPGDAAKVLKAIRKRQKGEDTEASETDSSGAAILTVGRAVEFLLATIKNAAQMPETDAADLFHGSVRIMDAWETSGVSEDTLNKWASNVARGVAPGVEILGPAAPVLNPPVAPETAPEPEQDEEIALHESEQREAVAA